MNKMNKLSLVALTAMSMLAACSSDKTAGTTEEADGRLDSADSKTLLAWNASAGQYRVNVSGDKMSGSAGGWYFFEKAGNGGAAKITWPAELDSTEESLLNPVIDQCQGLCGEIELKPGSSGEKSQVGVGFGVEGLKVPSQSEIQTTLCLEYSSSMAMNVVVDFEDDEDGISVRLPSSENVRETCKDFAHLDGALAKSFHFIFESDKDVSGSFNISKVNWTVKVQE